MLVVITHYAPVIASVQCMVDVRKVVTSHLTLRINPNFTSKHSIVNLDEAVQRVGANVQARASRLLAAGFPLLSLCNYQS